MTGPDGRRRLRERSRNPDNEEEFVLELREYRVFIGHCWAYTEDYYRLEHMLDAAPNFKWSNFSVPEHDPFYTASEAELYEALRSQIKPTAIVIILSGMYVAYRDWIQREIDLAVEMEKPVIGIVPRGQEKVPQDVQNAALEMVGWNTSSIVNAIRRWAL
jgi:hypothetical protein